MLFDYKRQLYSAIPNWVGSDLLRWKEIGRPTVMMYPQKLLGFPQNWNTVIHLTSWNTSCRFSLQIMCDLEQDSNSNTTAHVKSRENVLTHIDLKLTIQQVNTIKIHEMLPLITRFWDRSCEISTLLFFWKHNNHILENNK